MDVPLTPHRSWWVRYRLHLGVLCLVALATAVILPTDGRNSSEETLVPVHLGPLQAPVAGFGTLVPRIAMVHASPDTAQVESIEVKPGTRVEVGTVLLRLSDPELQKAVQDAETEVARQELLLEELLLNQQLEVSNQRLVVATTEGRRAVAERELNAEKELEKAGIASRIQLLRTERELESARLEEDSAREGLRILRDVHGKRQRLQQRMIDGVRADLERAEARNRNLTVRARLAGTVSEILVSPGESVVRGAALLRVVSTDDLVALVRIAQSKADAVTPGATVRLGILSREIPARVLRVDPTVKEGLVDVEIEPTDSLAPEVRLGQSVSASIDTELIKDVLRIENVLGVTPNQALELPVRTADGTVENRRILFGSVVGDQVEVISGAREGETLIVGAIE